MTINTNNLEAIRNSSVRLVSKTGQIKDHKMSKEELLKDVEQNHNCSWYEELYNRNKGRLDTPALSYRGNIITYREMFHHMKEYAKALRQMGYGKGNEFPICLSNTPELVYIMGAVSMIGGKVNIFSDHFDDEYVRQIIDDCNTDIVFVEDNHYKKIKGGIAQSKCSNVVCISLRDSLNNDIDPYASEDYQTGRFEDSVAQIKSEEKSKTILSQEDFVQKGRNYDGKLEEDVDLDTEFAITYTSGSTNAKRPKAIVHNVRSFNTVARFHDKTQNGGFDMSKYTVLALIPPYSNSDIISCISDSLMQGSKLALEPIYDMDFFIKSLQIYRPNYIAATRSYYVDLAKKILYDPQYKAIKMPYLFLCFSAGEHLEMNEEKLINKALKKVKAGTSITHTPMSLVKVSEAGGDCEHGSIFYTLFRALKNIKPSNRKRGEAAGMQPLPFVDVAILDEDGNHLPPFQIGRIVANSPCTMKCYKNNPEATEAFFIKDADGKTWGALSVYGFLDKSNNVCMRGRIPNEEEIIPPFLINKEILRDTKNILSCETIFDKDHGFIAHIEFQPTMMVSKGKALHGAYERSISKYPDLSRIGLCFRIHDFAESFPLTGSGKRDSKKLQEEGFTDMCVMPYSEKEEYVIKPVNEEEKVKSKKNNHI